MMDGLLSVALGVLYAAENFVTLGKFMLIAILQQVHCAGYRFFCRAGLLVIPQRQSDDKPTACLLLRFAKPSKNIQSLPGLLNPFLVET